MMHISDYTGSTSDIMSTISHTSVGHSGKCTHCHLCLKLNAKMKHLCKLQSQPQFKETYTWLKQHKPELNNAACLCLPCVKQIQRNHHKEFTPRWLTKPPVPPKLCNVQHCQNVVHAKTSLMSAAALETCLKAKVNDQSTLIGLCREHYTKMYMILNNAPCASCQTKPKKGESFNRHCSSPEVVNEYLSQVSEEKSALTSSSTICFTCYKYFQSIIAQVTGKGKPLVPTESLGAIVARLTLETQMIREKGESIDCSEFYENSTLHNRKAPQFYNESR